uniref:Uncharacterized protein n=1 Tax=Anguilla anguilla TaxID=7936 RepID=A0A0E9SB90_ANGAN
MMVSVSQDFYYEITKKKYSIFTRQCIPTACLGSNEAYIQTSTQLDKVDLLKQKTKNLLLKIHKVDKIIIITYNFI